MNIHYVLYCMYNLYVGICEQKNMYTIYILCTYEQYLLFICPAAVQMRITILLLLCSSFVLSAEKFGRSGRAPEDA